jgi:RimJ/RimL family protein N-acetyltransferase
MGNHLQVPGEFTTTRLRLRKPVDEDAPRILSGWTHDEEVTRYLTWRPYDEISEARAHVARCKMGWDEGSPLVWMIESLESRALIGSLAARPGLHGVNLGYLLARPFWGQGFMVEALEPVVSWWLDQERVFRVWATTDVENHASQSVLRKAGFQLEGVLRKWELHPNLSDEPRDSACYSRTK